MALSVPSSENDVLPFKVRMKHPSLSPVRDQPLDEDRKSAAADKDVDQLPLFDLEAILDATDNFAEHNKIGEGGFGPVYKGKLEDGQRVAVKKLAQGSMQGAEEFMNEVILIAKLQHRNLVRLLGCCIDDNERMLVYEYLRNQSLDTFIYDEGKRRLLRWHKRFEIILGIARGLQYLHEDSRFRIIHRDLKASNVLLDRNMIPKISDFGIARMFGGDQTTAYTLPALQCRAIYSENGLLRRTLIPFSQWLHVSRICNGWCDFDEIRCLQLRCAGARDHHWQEESRLLRTRARSQPPRICMDDVERREGSGFAG